MLRGDELIHPLVPPEICHPSRASADVHSIQRQIANHIEYTLASSRFDLDSHRAYIATARR